VLVREDCDVNVCVSESEYALVELKSEATQ